MSCKSLFVPLFFFFWSLHCLPFDLRLLITPLVSFGHCIVCPLIYGFWLPLWYLLVIALSALWFTASDYPFGIFWLPLWYLLITSLISSDYPFGIFWLPLWYLLITPLVIFWLPLWYLLITPLVSSNLSCQHKENSTWIEILTEQSIIHIKAGKKCIWK